MAKRDVADVLARTRKVFETARLGLADLESADPGRRIAGWHNVIVFGRSVLFVLQTLRSVDRAGFEEWYAPFLAEMKDDPLLMRFHALRNELEKEGRADTTTEVHVDFLDMADLAPLTRNPPPGATGFFVGDAAGGSGWDVRLPDGRSEKYYVQLPETVRMRASMQLHDPPALHLGRPIQDQSAAGLARLYIAYLGRAIDEAEARFGTTR